MRIPSIEPITLREANEITKRPKCIIVLYFQITSWEVHMLSTAKRRNARKLLRASRVLSILQARLERKRRR